MKHRARHGLSTSKGIGTDEQRIEGQWFNISMAKDKATHTATRWLHMPGMRYGRQLSRSHSA